ncbi:MAG: MaoC family dehydratase [Deltaproteobacteria bacterium]|nr:MaoC family dehydratase [Deltaproteobacteria bacterium]MBW2116644.1 MaoC family dehydratase [Deltaproteobacteria bacterium]MBW2343247.1 MaoC family dehydratase [Deltaproteobacteria bacterium]
MRIARKSMEVGQALPPVQKEVTFENIRLFSMWSNRNIHTDWEVATKGGFPAPIAQGLMSHAYLCEMLTQFFGKNWLQGGKIEVKFIRYTLPGDVVKAMGVVRERIEEGAAVRLNCDVWCESLSGEKTVVGTASAVVD